MLHRADKSREAIMKRKSFLQYIITQNDKKLWTPESVSNFVKDIEQVPGRADPYMVVNAFNILKIAPLTIRDTERLLRVLIKLVLELVDINEEGGRGDLNLFEICKISSSLKNVSDGLMEVRHVLALLSSKLIELDSNPGKPIRATEISLMLSGMRNMSSDTAEVRNLIFCFATKIEECPSALDARGIGECLYSLQNMKSDCSEVLRLLRALTKKIKDCEEVCSLTNLYMALFGLKSMSAEPLEVRQILSELAEQFILLKATKLNSVDTNLGEIVIVPESHEMRNAMIGLTSMNDNIPEVRIILDILRQHINQFPYAFPSSDVAGSIGAMRSMSLQSQEANVILRNLSYKMQLCTDKFTSISITNIMYGISSANPVSKGVLFMLPTLSEKIIECEDHFQPSELAICLASMKNMTNLVNDKRCLILLSSFTDKIRNCKIPFRAHDLSRCFIGMQVLKCVTPIRPEIVNMLRVLSDQIKSAQGSWSIVDISTVIYGLKDMSSDLQEVREIVSQMSFKLDASDEEMRFPVASSIFLGLRSMKSDSPEVRYLLSVLIGKFSTMKVFPFNKPSVIFDGMGKMDNSVSEVRELKRLLGKWFLNKTGHRIEYFFV